MELGWVRALLLILLPLGCYIPAMRGGFIWDDNHMVFNNALIRQGLEGLYAFWFTRENFDYFPLTSTTLWLEWRLWGFNAPGYHVVNVLLHIGSAFSLWAILRRLRVPAGYLLALVFAVHPVAVASVAWIAERKNTLSMFFALLALLGYLRFEDRAAEPGAVRRRVWGSYAMALVCFQLALFSKTSVVMIPVVFLLLAWWRRGRIAMTDLLRTAPFFFLSLFMGLVTIWFQYGKAIGPGIVRPEGMLSRLLGAGWCLWFYLYKALVPLNLLMVNPRWDIDPSDVLACVPLVAYAFFLWLLWENRKGWGRHLLAGIGYHAVTLLPVLGFFKIYFMRFSLVGDHWHYVSFMGPLIAGVGLCAAWVARQSPRVRRAAWVAAALYVVTLSALTARQATLYTNEKDLWLWNVKKNPGGWVAYHNLGVLSPTGSDEAIGYFREAVRLNPDYHEAYYGLGTSLKVRGALDEAIESFKNAVRLRPDYFLAQNDLGLAYMEKKQFADAERCFRQAVQTRGNFTDALMNLGCALAVQGESWEAEKVVEQAVRQGMPRVSVHYLLGLAWQQAGNAAEARRCFLQALALMPNHHGALINMGALFAAEGNVEQARAYYERDLEENPEALEGAYNLGGLFFKQGDFKRAEGYFTRVLQLNPNLPLVHYNLGASILNLGRIDDAVRCYTDAVARFPQVGELHGGLAIALVRAGRKEDAVVEFQKAVQLAPQMLDISVGLADTLLDLNRPAEALDQYRNVLRNVQAVGNTPADTLAKLLDRAVLAADKAGDKAQAQAWREQRKALPAGNPAR